MGRSVVFCCLCCDVPSLLQYTRIQQCVEKNMGSISKTLPSGVSLLTSECGQTQSSQTHTHACTHTAYNSCSPPQLCTLMLCLLTDINVKPLETLVESLVSAGDALKAPRVMVRAARDTVNFEHCPLFGSACTQWKQV